ncbi:DUF4097 family beta strand repeat-containing protein [Solibacillus sp. MA9]|uniref:DUF4097 family beta strand repeat-containing protein n=1 Tax=Solibacillus palustris TaxID=2908203 RepID=A0ABS9UHB2_9BACL|nr:DUF4097 family beta strand repeat-containing protein [Solibacillus sp. MA9]MCH7323733.1 DUF4097 family beta strand repeat-containing protein [Solibacillus sp. MA9]
MNEQQFLDLLEGHLQKINSQELADIRRDFEEYFENGRAEGKTIEEIIESFGNMDELANELLASYDEEDFVQAVSLHKNDAHIPYSNVKMDINNVTISIVATDANEARIETKDKDDLTTAIMTIEDGTLVVKATRQDKVRRFWFITIVGSVGPANVIVYLPKKQYEQISITNHNGAIKIADVFAKQFELHADNGRIMTNTIEGSILEARTSNGRIILENTVVQQVKAISQNGRIEMENSKGQQYDVESYNGRIVVKNVEAQVQARSYNGRIEAEFATVKYPLQFRTDNGRIMLATAEKLENVAIEGSTHSGDVTIYSEKMSRYEHGTKEHTIQLKTSNGKISVEELVAQ